MSPSIPCLPEPFTNDLIDLEPPREGDMLELLIRKNLRELRSVGKSRPEPHQEPLAASILDLDIEQVSMETPHGGWMAAAEDEKSKKKIDVTSGSCAQEVIPMENGTTKKYEVTFGSHAQEQTPAESGATKKYEVTFGSHAQEQTPAESGATKKYEVTFESHAQEQTPAESGATKEYEVTFGSHAQEQTPAESGATKKYEVTFESHAQEQTPAGSGTTKKYEVTAGGHAQVDKPTESGTTKKFEVTVESRIQEKPDITRKAQGSGARTTPSRENRYGLWTRLRPRIPLSSPYPAPGGYRPRFRPRPESVCRLNIPDSHLAKLDTDPLFNGYCQKWVERPDLCKDPRCSKKHLYPPGAEKRFGLVAVTIGVDGNEIRRGTPRDAFLHLQTPGRPIFVPRCFDRVCREWEAWGKCQFGFHCWFQHPAGLVPLIYSTTANARSGSSHNPPSTQTTGALGSEIATKIEPLISTAAPNASNDSYNAWGNKRPALSMSDILIPTPAKAITVRVPNTSNRCRKAGGKLKFTDTNARKPCLITDDLDIVPQTQPNNRTEHHSASSWDPESSGQADRRIGRDPARGSG